MSGIKNESMWISTGSFVKGTYMDRFFQEPFHTEEGMMRQAQIEDKKQRIADLLKSSVPFGGDPILTANAVWGDESLGNMLSDLGIKEDDTMKLRDIKKVTIECADGSTFEGNVTRVDGCPFDFGSLELGVRISKAANGTYGIERVVFDNPATIVFWTDGTKTVVNCIDNAIEKEKIVDGKTIKVRKAQKCDTYSKEVGLAMAIAKKHFGNQGNYNNVFKKFIEE